MEYCFTVSFEAVEEGGYVALCPALPGVVTAGDTFVEARARVKEAIEGYIESLQKDGQPVPADRNVGLDWFEEEIRITIS